MTVRRDRMHHRPRVYKAPGARTMWSFPWKVVCTECGYRSKTGEMTQHGAFIDALIHSAQVR